MARYITLGASRLSFFVFLQDHQRVREGKLRELHREVTGIVLELNLIVGALDEHDTSLSLPILIVKLKYLRVGNQSLIWLLALLIEDSEVEPHLSHLRVQSGRLDYVLEGISVVPGVVVEDSQGSPVHCLAWVLVGGLLEVLKGFLVVLQGHVGPAIDVEGVRLSPLVFAVSSPDKLKSLIDLALKEVVPCKMQIDFEVGLILVEGSLIGLLSLNVVFGFLI
jgi:hypothetical protein